MSRLILGLWTLLFASHFCVGQVIPLYPDMPNTYASNMPLVTPAYVPTVGKYVFGGIYKFKIGEPNLAIFDINAAVILGEENANKQLIRLNFSNEKEGPYIATPRGSFNYAYQISLADELKLTSGISVGYVSRNYTTPPSTSGQGSVILPDGGIGLDIKYKSTRLGVSMMQFLNSEGTALQSVIQLHTYYHGYLSLEQRLNHNWSIKENFLLRLLPGVINQIIGGVRGVYLGLYELGLTYYQRRGVGFHFLGSLDDDAHLLKISVGYNSSFLAQSPVWTNSFELGLNYTIQ